MFKHALICTDFTDGLQRLVHFVPFLAAAGIVRIVFLHTVPLREQREVPQLDAEKITQARKRLAVALQEVPANVEVKVEIQSGQPLETILRAIRQYEIDGVILGTPNRTLLSEKLFGSTTVGLSQRLTVPLFSLRPQLISAFTSEELALRCQHLFRCLLIPYDGSKPANYLVQQIKHQVQDLRFTSLKSCLLCWVVNDNSLRGMSKEQLIQQAYKNLESVKTELVQLGLQVNLEVRQGNPIAQILEAAQENDISAIAISSDSLGRLLEWSVPSFTGELLRRSWHPVIFFPSQKQP